MRGCLMTVPAPTGSDFLDALLGGGIPRGTSVILQGPPGEEKETIAWRFLKDGWDRGEAAIVALSSMSPRRFRERITALGIDVKALEDSGRLIVIDWFSHREEAVTDVKDEGSVLKVSVDLTNVGVAINWALNRAPAGTGLRAVFEVVSPALSAFNLPEVYLFAQVTKAKLERREATALFLVEKEMHDPATLSNIQQPFDGVIDIERVREGDRIVRKIGVPAMRGVPLAGSKYVPFELEAAGPSPARAPVEAHQGTVVAQAAETAATTAPVLQPAQEKMGSPTGRSPPDAIPSVTTPPQIAAQPTEPKAAEPRAQQPQVAERVRAAGAKIPRLCPSCGATLGESDEFCYRCGVDLPKGGDAKIAALMRAFDAILATDSRNLDALFAKGAALAQMERYEEAIRALNGVTRLEPRYPGVWLLKAKVYGHLGKPKMAESCRERAIELQGKERLSETGLGRPPPAPTGAPRTRVPRRVPAGAAKPRLAPGKASRKRPRRPPPAATGAPRTRDGPATSPVPRRVPAGAKKPRLAPGKASTKRLTQQVVPLQAGRTAGFTNGAQSRPVGLTSGRTNGLVNGRGRTNGLVNGRGRTNGLVNGRGRTNGLVNGRGRTNGLVNGFTSARAAIADGLTNGAGFTNGFGGARFPRDIRARRWKLAVIPVIAFALLILPLVALEDVHGPPIAIDGNFGDWPASSLIAMGADPQVASAIDVVQFGIMDNRASLAFYVAVAGAAMQGGGTAPGAMDTVRVFIDADASPATGYHIDGLGADRMIEVSGINGGIRLGRIWEFDRARDPRDWGGWGNPRAVSAAVQGSRIEVEADWLLVGSNRTAVSATVRTQSWEGQIDVGDVAIALDRGTLLLVTQSQAPEILAGPGVPLLNIVASADHESVTLDSLGVRILGTEPFASASAIRLLDTTGRVLSSRIPVSRDVGFTFNPERIPVGSTATYTVVADFTGGAGGTFGLQISPADPVGPAGAVVTVRDSPAVRSLGYVGLVPAAPQVDGGFAEWTALGLDPAGDPGVRGDANVDIRSHGAIANGSSLYLYADVAGHLFAGTPVPQAAQAPPTTGTSAAADSDRDTVPDSVDPYPYDFNNDGLADSDTNGDYDGDGITDYGYAGGTDPWLNTTIPGTFPAPYAGKIVSVYIGPTNRPVVLGEDVLRFFLDTDNRTLTGYAIAGIGADRMVEVRGTDGEVTQSAVLAFAGSFPGDWAWTPVSPVTVATGYRAIELAVSFNASSVYLEMGDFWGGVDTTNPGPSRASAAPSINTGTFGAGPKTSFDAAPAAKPLSVPWQQGGPGLTGSPDPPHVLDISGNLKYYLTSTNHATETACGTNKVASTTQGSAPVDQVALNAGQDACWYLDATTGTTIPGPNDWESLLDVTRTDEIGAIGYKSTTGSGGNFPKQLDWTGTAWGTPETELATAGAAVENVRVIWDTVTDSTLFWILVNTGATITVYKCTNVDTCSSETTATTQGVGTAPERHWDAAIEASSGELLLLYDNPAAVANDFCYRTRTAGSSGTWSSETCFNHASVATTNPSFAYLTLANNPGSNRIGMGAFDTTNDDFVVGVWDGGAWVNVDKAVSTAVTLTNGWGGTVLAEDASDEFVAVAGNGADSMAECEWTSAGGWEATCATFDPNTAAGNDLRIVSARPLRSTDKGMVCQGDDLADDTCWRWGGVSGIGGTRGTIKVLTTNDGAPVGGIALNGATLTGTLGDDAGVFSITLASWTPAANDLILVVVAMRRTTIVPSVAGNGLTWTMTGDVTNAQAQMRLFMFQAQGASPSTGSIVVTVTANDRPVAVQAQRFSGVDTSTPVEATATHAGPPVTDDNDMLHSVTTITPNAWAVASGTHRSVDFTVPGGETGININLLGGLSSGTQVSASLWYEGPVATPASTQLGALDDLSAVKDWSMIVVSLKPLSVTDMRTGFAWNPSQSGTSDGLVVYYSNTAGSLSYNTYDDATDTWGTASTFTSAGSHEWIDVVATRKSDNTNKAFVVTSNSNFDILAYRWTGSGAPANEQSVTADTVSENYPYWDIAFAEDPSIQYDVRIEIWNIPNNAVDATIGTCLDATTYGDDIQCLISGVAQTTLTNDQVVRIRVAHSSAFSSIKIDYDDADTTGDSRVTIPVPEFDILAVPFVSLVIVSFLVERKRRSAGRSGPRSQSPPKAATRDGRKEPPPGSAP